MLNHAKIYVFWSFLLALLLLASHYIRHTLSATLTSLALAYLLNPLLKYLENRGFSRWLSLIFLYGIVLIVCLFASFILIPYLGYQYDLLAVSLPGYVNNLHGAVEKWKFELSSYYSSEDLNWVTQRINDFLYELTTDFSEKGYEHFKGLLFAFFDILIAPIVVFFLLYYKEAAKRFFFRLIPEGAQTELKELGFKINRTLERFLYAMFLDAILVGVLCSIALYILGIDFPILNGILAGIATVVPFIGATLSVIPPLLIGYLKTGDLMIIPKVCGVYFLIHVVVEGNLIKPLIMRGALHLNPLAVIFALMAMGEIMGFWGVVLAVPVTAVVKLCSEDIHHLMLREADDKSDDV